MKESNIYNLTLKKQEQYLQNKVKKCDIYLIFRLKKQQYAQHNSEEERRVVNLTFQETFLAG